MNYITTNSIPEDRYITYLAGLTGQSPVGFLDNYHAHKAQKHTLSNRVISNIIGITKGIATTALGVSAYPLFRDGIKETFFASRLSVANTYVENIRALEDANFTFRSIFEPLNATSYLRNYFETSYNDVRTFKETLLLDEKDLMKIRALNYVAKVWETLANHTLLIGTTAVVLTALFAYSQNQRYSEKETEAEERLKQSLADRFEKIATRLIDLESNKQAQECARRILQNQLQINKEIENLHLPSLTWKEIKMITKPVFDAAQKIQP